MEFILDYISGFAKEHLGLLILLIYVAIISVISIIVCFYDKKISKLNRVGLRTPEKWLLILSALGGSLVMFLTMLLIRHKTKHLKFMLGIPIIMVIQAAAIGVLLYLGVL